MKDLVGKIFKTNNYGDLKVVNYIGSSRYLVEFISTGYKCEAAKFSIETGGVKDYLLPKVKGVGCLGYMGHIEKRFRKRQVNDLYGPWNAMLQRCYDINAHNYSYYGAKGVKVCDRWLRFDYFVEDVQKLDGWEDKLNNWSRFSLDKDKKSEDSLIYSPETCCWLDDSQQNLYSSNCNDFYGISPSGEIVKGHIKESFARKHGLHSSCIRKCLKGLQKTHKGWRFYEC